MTKEQYQKGIEKMLSGTKEERIFLASESLGLFCLFYFQHYFKYGLSDYQYTFISDMEEITECKIRELLLITFREGAKTTFAKLYLLWLISFKKGSMSALIHLTKKTRKEYYLTLLMN